jgi:hypothetical protein
VSVLSVAPEIVAAASGDLQSIGSAVRTATSATAAQTTAIAAPAADEVSEAITALFGAQAREFQALSANASAFHDRFVSLLNGGAAQYVSTEIANAEQMLANAPALLVGSGQGSAASIDLTNPFTVVQSAKDAWGWVTDTWGSTVDWVAGKAAPRFGVTGSENVSGGPNNNGGWDITGSASGSLNPNTFYQNVDSSIPSLSPYAPQNLPVLTGSASGFGEFNPNDGWIYLTGNIKTPLGVLGGYIDNSGGALNFQPSALFSGPNPFDFPQYRFDPALGFVNAWISSNDLGRLLTESNVSQIFANFNPNDVAIDINQLVNAVPGDITNDFNSLPGIGSTGGPLSGWNGLGPSIAITSDVVGPWGTDGIQQDVTGVFDFGAGPFAVQVGSFSGMSAADMYGGMASGSATVFGIRESGSVYSSNGGAPQFSFSVDVPAVTGLLQDFAPYLF